MKILGDTKFNYPSYADAINQAAKGGPTWVYVFDYYPHRLFETSGSEWKMSTHGFELLYLFNSTMSGMFPITYDKNDKKIVDLTGELWTNFAKFGKPTPEPIDGVKWEQFTETFPKNLHITLKLEMEDKFLEGRPLFWSNIVPTLERSGTNPLFLSILGMNPLFLSILVLLASMSTTLVLA